MSKKVETIELKAIEPKIITVEIEGDTDLVLNKMDDVTKRQLTDERKDKAKTLDKPNEWEKIITSIHWRDGNPKEYTEKALKECLKKNAPCITTFGLKKSFGEAVVRNKVDQYATKFNASVNLIGNDLIPITFAEHIIDEKLMSPQKGKPVLVHLNRFTGWTAKLKISCLENVFSVEQIINIINLAGFGIGIGSGRSSGYGRYHVKGIE